MRSMEALFPRWLRETTWRFFPGWFSETLREAGAFRVPNRCFAATTGPGFAAALLVGASAAKGLALGARRPFLAVNHLEGHLLSPFFGESEIPPHVALIVSGGHTLLFDVEEYGRYRLLGRTLDDAAGEAFRQDGKAPWARLSRRHRSGPPCAKGIPGRFNFPRSMIASGDLNFSFSGLKTSVRYFLESGLSPRICRTFAPRFRRRSLMCLWRSSRELRKSADGPAWPQWRRQRECPPAGKDCANV